MADTPGPWIINVSGRAYGPYEAEQMRAFASEGRLIAMSQVARAGEDEFRNALDDPELAQFFIPARQANVAMLEPLKPREPERPASFGRLEGSPREAAEASAGPSHVIVIADMKSRSINGLEEELLKLGQACQVLPQVWILSTEASVNTVRNLLTQQLGKLDVLLVIDATRDKAAWFNFGPEMDARIRRVWSKQLDSKASSES
jgi:hypothetical protein